MGDSLSGDLLAGQSVEGVDGFLTFIYLHPL